MDEQCERIARVRKAAEHAGVHLVINARVDCFLSSSFSEQSHRVTETIRRASSYIKAGADCVYPIGPSDAETVRALQSQIDAPMNVLMTSRSSLQDLQTIGVARVSFGPFLFRSVMGKFVDAVTALGDADTGAIFDDLLTQDEIGRYIRQRAGGLTRQKGCPDQRSNALRWSAKICPGVNVVPISIRFWTSASVSSMGSGVNGARSTSVENMMQPEKVTKFMCDDIASVRFVDPACQQHAVVITVRQRWAGNAKTEASDKMWQRIHQDEV